MPLPPRRRAHKPHDGGRLALGEGIRGERHHGGAGPRLKAGGEVPVLRLLENICVFFSLVFFLEFITAGNMAGFSLKVRHVGVLFGGFAKKRDGDSWFTWLFSLIYQGPSISPKRTPMLKVAVVVKTVLGSHLGGR